MIVSRAAALRQLPPLQPLLRPSAGRFRPQPPAMILDPPLSRRETLLLLPLTLVGLGGIRYATIDAFPSSLEGPIVRAPLADMTGKVVLITGANTGIGFETALALAQQGATVVLAGRTVAKLSDAAERIRARAPPGAQLETLQLDLASLDAVRAAAKAFLERHPRLDVLINNAGVSAIPERSETIDGNELVFQVNFLGHFLLTNLLMPALRAAPAPRVVNVASRAAFLPNAKLDLAELQHAGGAYDACQTPVDCPAYASSKLEQLLFSRELQRRLGGADSRATVVSLHPGLVATELLRYSTVAGPAGSLSPGAPEAVDAQRRALNFWGFKVPEQGAQTTIYAASAPTLTARTAGGKFLRECAEAEAEAVAATDAAGLGYRDAELAAGLWREAERLSGSEFKVSPLV